MVAFKVVENPCNSDELLLRLCSYVVNPEKTHNRVGGCGVFPSRAYSEMKETQMLWGTEWGRGAYHLVVGFEDDLVFLPDDAMEIAPMIAALFFPNYQVLYGVHGTQAHLHIHFAVCTTSLANGKKLHIGHEELHQLREQISGIVERYANDICGDL